LALQALLFSSVIVFRKNANYNLFVLISAGKPPGFRRWYRQASHAHA
jgi:hypothetical protein